MRRAIHYSKLAAEQALRHYAYPEATDHLSRRLEMIEQLPENRERDLLALDTLVILGPALIATAGYTSPEVERTYGRALELCERTADSSHHFTVLWNLAGFHMVRGELQTSDHITKELFLQADGSNDGEIDLMAQDALAQQSFLTGCIRSAHQHAEYFITRYNIEKHRALATLYSEEDPGVTCGVFDALILWLLGYPAQSTARLQSALDLAHELGNPHSTGPAMSFACITLQIRGELEAVQAQADDLVRYATQHDLMHWQGLGNLFLGWGLGQQGGQGIEKAQNGLATWRSNGAELLVPYCLGVICETHRSLGDLNSARQFALEAKALVDRTQESWFEAELHRLHGGLLLEQDDAQHLEAEDCFERALDVARDQQAKLLELRAAVSLSRLWRRQGKYDDACTLLGPIYDWFEEGLETADLREAKVLLDELQNHESNLPL